ncbi:MAG TPA: hypothetical protein PK308_00050 [Phycisphaerales bacterium]|nr:hypothetical protein [Phycisphaerales bacterium]
MTSPTAVCRQYGPGERMTCPAPGRTPGSTCGAYLGTVGPHGHARVCLASDAPPAKVRSNEDRTCPDRRCKARLRVELWTDAS